MLCAMGEMGARRNEAACERPPRIRRGPLRMKGSILGVAREELAGAFLLRMVDDVVRRALLDDDAAVHEDLSLIHI